MMSSVKILYIFKTGPDSLLVDVGCGKIGVKHGSKFIGLSNYNSWYCYLSKRKGSRLS